MKDLPARPYMMSKNCVTVVASDGRPITISDTDPTYGAIIDSIREGDWERVEILMSKPQAIRSFSHGALDVQDGCVIYDGEEVHGYIVDKILQFIDEGIDAMPLMNFLEKLMLNPSKRCVDQLFSFLEHGNMPIDPDGDFYAYKAVRSDFTDKHSGQLDNSIGQTVKVARNKVDDNPANPCSHGLHAGSLAYVSSFASPGDNKIIVKIDPTNVVAVPQNEDNKLRCCSYTVVGLYQGPMGETVIDDDYFEDDDEDDLLEEEVF